jgi:hypothetical protein
MITLRKTALAALTAITTISAFASLPARAGEEPRDMSCQRLWEDRNYIFKDAGYCFKTSRAINFFGNAGCTVDKESNLRLTVKQRSYLRVLKQWERRKGCGSAVTSVTVKEEYGC